MPMLHVMHTLMTRVRAFERVYPHPAILAAVQTCSRRPGALHGVSHLVDAMRESNRLHESFVHNRYSLVARQAD